MRDMGIKNANWVMALPRVMTAANSGRSKGKNEVAPYNAVFGMSYDHPIISANNSFQMKIYIQEQNELAEPTYTSKNE